MDRCTCEENIRVVFEAFPKDIAGLIVEYVKPSFIFCSSSSFTHTEYFEHFMCSGLLILKTLPTQQHDEAHLNVSLEDASFLDMIFFSALRYLKDNDIVLSRHMFNCCCDLIFGSVLYHQEENDKVLSKHMLFNDTFFTLVRRHFQ